MIEDLRRGHRARKLVVAALDLLPHAHEIGHVFEDGVVVDQPRLFQISADRGERTAGFDAEGDGLAVRAVHRRKEHVVHLLPAGVNQPADDDKRADKDQNRTQHAPNPVIPEKAIPPALDQLAFFRIVQRALLFLRQVLGLF